MSPEAVDIAGDDTPPTLVSATLEDLDADGRIDAVTLVFDENVLDASFDAAQWTFNTFPATAIDTLTTANDTTVRVLYATDDLAIDTSVTGAAIAFLAGTSVSDLYGNLLAAIADVTESDGARPVATAAAYSDPDTNGVDAGDLIDVTFSETLTTVAGVVAGDILLPVSGDSLGTTPAFALNAGALQITLGTTPVLSPAGTYNATITAGASSGLNIAATPTGTLADASANNATSRTGTGFTPEAVDIAGDDTAPTLVSATLEDLDADGRIDAVTLVFDENVLDASFDPAAWTFNTFSGTGIDTLTTADDTTVRVLYATDDLPIDTSLTGAAIVFLTGTSVTDLYGNLLAAIADVIESDGARPVPTAAAYSDPDTNGVDAGDLIDVTFSETLTTVATVVAADIVLPVSGDSLGTGPSFVT